jgi:ureidoglycolate lyase
MKLYIKKITKDNFSLYGDLITIRDKSSEGINNNTTQSFFDLANIEILGNDKRARLNIFNAKKRIFPLNIDMLEMHPFSSQVFFPIIKADFIVLVAPNEIKPNLKKIECFKVSNGDGINFKSRVWHFPLISIQDAKFITIDKKYAEKNIEIYKFTENEKFILNYE